MTRSKNYITIKELYGASRAREQRTVFNMNAPAAGQPTFQFSHTVPMVQPRREHFAVAHQPTEIETFDITTENNPSKWGPNFWYVLHMSSKAYPETASPITADRMKGFIRGLPYTLPCETCKVHAIEYIESHAHELDAVCQGKESLFKFFFDFHNTVNQRLGKNLFPIDIARKLYT